MQKPELILTNLNCVDEKGCFLTSQAIAIAKGIIVYSGPMTELPKEYQGGEVDIEDCRGRLVTPGLIDCHTHLVYAGNRADEFKRRLTGETYAEIAKSGGGIVSTVKKTREASKALLLEESLSRILALKAEGVTTVEIKSGYGLDLETEMKMLEVARELGRLSGVRVKTTFLGAHALAPEYQGRSRAYVDFLCEEALPILADRGLVDAVDVFCESIGFSLQETEAIFLKAKTLGLAIKCHAEQLSLMGASALAASMGALSCDHLEYLDRGAAEIMAKNKTVAVLLPGAFYFLGEKKLPPLSLLRELGIPIAIASDANPGSSPTASLLLMMNMAAVLFGLTVEEILASVTSVAALALGLNKVTGQLKAHLAADLVCWEVYEPSTLCYHFAYPLPHKTMIAGKWV